MVLLYVLLPKTLISLPDGFTKYVCFEIYINMPFNSFCPNYDFLRSYPFYPNYDFLCSYNVGIISSTRTHIPMMSQNVCMCTGSGHFRLLYAVLFKSSTVTPLTVTPFTPCAMATMLMPSHDSDVVLNSNHVVFEPIDRQVHDSWMQLWLVEDSDTDCDFEGFQQRIGFQQFRA